MKRKLKSSVSSHTHGRLTLLPYDPSESSSSSWPLPFFATFQRVAPLLLLLLLVTRTTHAQMLDLNANGASDLWEVVFGAENFDPDFDSDGDGAPNRSEATAGTDPRDARSVLRIAGYRMTTNGFELTVAGALGKRYELQTSEVTDGPTANWTIEASIVPRTNSALVFVSPADRPSKFFRLGVSDVDTDGDGLNDWEEYLLGLDPLSATSNGQT